jgi:hypothetical protein
MICDEVQPLLPELAGGLPRTAGPVEVHLAICRLCAEELAGIRQVVFELRALRGVILEPPQGALDRLLEILPPTTAPSLLRRFAGNQRAQQAALSLGGAVIGASAVGLLWWRTHRPVPLGNSLP